MSNLVKQIDRGLKRYYAHQNAPYFNDKGIGLFEEWCIDNGYDSDGVQQEFQQAPEDMTFIDFDPNFPINTSNDTKTHAIFKILFACYKEPAAFFNSPDLPDEYTQMQIATKKSLLESNDIPHIKDHYNEPHISYIEPTQKAPHHDPYKHQRHHDPYAHQGHHTAYSDDQDDDIYGYNHSSDDDVTDRYMMRYPQKQKKQREHHRKQKHTAKDAMYESDLISSNLQISSIKDVTLRERYQEAMKLRNNGNKALNMGEYKQALKHYSKVFVYLGSNSIRRLHYFCNDDGAMDPFQDKGHIDMTNGLKIMDNVYKAMDKLRTSAYTQIATVYAHLNEWDKVIEQCSKVLEDDDMNIKALIRRASAYRQQKKLEKAKDDLMKAKESGIVDIEIEMELNALKGGGSSITSFTNSNWPKLPLRDIAFEEWLRNRNSSMDSIDGILYPVPLQKNTYKVYHDEEILDMSVIWLDVDVAEKLIELNAFDINKQKKIYSYQTYVNQLSTGTLCSGYVYDYNQDKYLRIYCMLCENDGDLELRDDDQRTPLANAVRNNMTDLGIVLLKYGANVNDGSVKKEIKRNRNAQDLIRKGLGILRNNTLEAIQDVIRVEYGVEDRIIYRHILDCILSSWRDETSIGDID